MLFLFLQTKERAIEGNPRTGSIPAARTPTLHGGEYINQRRTKTMEFRNLYNVGELYIFTTTYDGTEVDCCYDSSTGNLKISEWQSRVGKGRDYKTATETVKREFEKTLAA